MRSELFRHRLTVVLAIIANIVPIVGVIGFSWDLLPILAIYWIEAVVYVARSSFESLFAVRPVDDDYYGVYIPLERLREKRGRVRIIDQLPPIFPRNIPFALNGGWLLFGLGTIAVLIMLFARPPGILDRGTLLGIGGMTILVVVRHTSALHESIRFKRYEEHTALSIFSRRRWIAVAIVAFLVPIVGIGANQIGIGFTATFTLIATAKLCYDILDMLTLGGQPPSNEPQQDETSIEVPETSPLIVIRTDRRGVILDTLFLGAMLALLPPVGFVIVFSSIAVGLLFGLPEGVATLIILFTARMAFEIPIAYLRHGNIEYRVYDDAVIAYDTTLDAPQWRIPRHEITDARANTALTSKFISGSFGKIRIECVNGSSQSLSLVRNPDDFVQALSH